jgi:hypothetical protein
MPPIDLILDLDDTLVQCAVEPDAFETKYDFSLQIDSETTAYIWKRPFLDDFMHWLFCDPSSQKIVNRVYVFSYGTSDYVRPTIEAILPKRDERYREVSEIWARDRCTSRIMFSSWGQQHCCVIRKHLCKFFRRQQPANKLFRQHTIMVDDTPEVMAGNYGNGVVIPKFDDPDVMIDDQCLFDLRELLSERLAKENISDVRKVCKCKGRLVCCFMRCRNYSSL